MATGYITSRRQCTLLPPSLPYSPGVPPPHRGAPVATRTTPPGEGPDPECSPGRATRPLPTGQRRCQLASRLDNRPRAPMAHRQLASPRPPSPTLAHASPPLSSPPSRPAAGALARNPPSSSANWPPLAPSRSPPIPSHPLAVARPAPAQPPYREGGSPDCPPWPTAPAPTPAPTPTPAPSRPLALSPTPCEPASRTKRPRAMVAGQRRPPPRDSATHPHTGRLVASLIDSPALIGPPSCVQMLPCPNSIPRGTFLHQMWATPSGAPISRCQLVRRRRQLAGSLPTGQRRRRLASLRQLVRRRCQLVNSAAQVSHVLGRGAAGLSLSKTLAPRRCQLAAGLGRAEDRRGSTPSVVSASSRSPPTARARTGTSVDGEVCLHKSSQGSG